MLVINGAVKLRISSIYRRKLSCSRYTKQKLSSALQLFDGIPQRNPVQENQKNNLRSAPPKHRNDYEALELFRETHASGAKLTRFVLCTALNSCAKTLNLKLGSQIHSSVIRNGYENNLYINSALVNLYSKCSVVTEAKRVFDGMERHDEVSWTSIVTGFSQNGRGKETILVFKEMMHSNIKPNCYTYVSLISACTCLDKPFAEVVIFHAHIIKLGMEMNSFVISTLIDCYSKCGVIDHARLVFDESVERDNIIFNSMISGYSQNLLGEETLKVFVEMRSENLNPTEHTLTSVLNSCGQLSVLQQGQQIHSLVIKMGCERNTFVICALIDMYSKCGAMNEARSAFDQTVERNGVLLTSMVMGYAQSGKGLDALKLFEKFLIRGDFIPDHICFTAILTACNHEGFLESGIKCFSMMEYFGLVPELDQYACLIELYSRIGHLSKAKELMEIMPYEPNYVMWSSFLHYCNVYGEVELGRDAFNELLKVEPSNAAPYVTMSNLYSKAGLWGDVSDIRKLMQQKGIRKNAGWSWIEVDKGVHVFSVGDGSHPQSREIFDELEKLNKEMGHKNQLL